MYRFAFRGRWLALLLLVLVAVPTTIRLGIWQLDRRDQRLDHNRLVTERGALAPSSLDELLAAGGAGSEAGIGGLEHRRAMVEGRYDPDREVLVMARSLAGTPGQHVLTPLVMGGGRAVLVNRGFVPVVDPEAPVPADAKPPDGTVRVEGVLRGGERGRFFPAEPGAAEAGTLGSVTGVDLDRLDAVLPYEVAPLYVRVESDEPRQGALPVPLAPAELGEGPHLGYAFQWFGIAGVFLVGWPVLVGHTARQRSRPRAGRQEGHGASAG